MGVGMNGTVDAGSMGYGVNGAPRSDLILLGDYTGPNLSTA